MPDVTCKQCGEPWDLQSIRHELFEGSPQYEKPENMPPRIRGLYETWLDEDPWSGTSEEKALREKLFKLVYDGGLGDGCPACWNDPSRVMDDEEKVANLERSMSTDGWDGDPLAPLDLMW